MRTRLPFILHRAALNVAESGTDIVLTWREFTGAVTVDPVSGSTLGTSVEKTDTVKGFVHFVQIATSAVRQFNEVEVGDCIVDFAADVVIDGRTGLRFGINGELWEPKKLSDQLGQTWDAVAQGHRIFRSVLLQKAS